MIDARTKFVTRYDYDVKCYVQREIWRLKMLHAGIVAWWSRCGAWCSQLTAQEAKSCRSKVWFGGIRCWPASDLLRKCQGWFERGKGIETKSASRIHRDCAFWKYIYKMVDLNAFPTFPTPSIASVKSLGSILAIRNQRYASITSSPRARD